jgi:hypothetical protein
MARLLGASATAGFSTSRRSRSRSGLPSTGPPSTIPYRLTHSWGT